MGRTPTCKAPLCKGSWRRSRLRGCRGNRSIKALVKTLSSTIPQSASRPAPFTQGSLLAFILLQARPQFAMVALRRPRGAFLGLPCSLGFRLASSATGSARLRPLAKSAYFGWVVYAAGRLEGIRNGFRRRKRPNQALRRPFSRKSQL